MATSKYCDHSPSAISADFSLAASGEPGLTLRMSAPTRSLRSARMACALSASPRQRSSITRSTAETAKVTPAALTHCRSTGASRR
jgi:hypothetical protein